ncbi:MAG TPA: hypothetical protein VGF13_16625, partial [Verrucomicrobiae bacterium]
VTISLPSLLLQLGQLRAKSKDRSFSSHMASLLRGDCAEEIEHLKDDLNARLQITRDPNERQRLAADLEALQQMDMSPERIAEQIFTERHEPTDKKSKAKNPRRN